ncbi:MAG: hypothetical protein VB853_09370 [Pirellulales bacterium]
MKHLLLVLLLGLFAFGSAYAPAAAPKNKAKNAKKKKTSFSKASSVFESLDKNKDWELSFRELAVAIEPKNMKKAQSLFKQLQSENDPKSKQRSTLNVSEFRDGYQKLKALSKQSGGGKKKKR